MSEMNDTPRICDTCRVILMHDGERWSHPAELRDKFSLAVCADPRPGRDAKAGEVRFGRGRSYTRDKFSMHGAVGEAPALGDTAAVVGTSGSYRPVTVEDKVRKPMSWAYLSDCGLYGLGTATAPGNIVGGSRALQAELRAIFWALNRIGTDRPVTLISDSLDAVELMAHWRAGGQNMPRGYTLQRDSGRQATLQQLAIIACEAGDRVRLTWVPKHDSHPLNDGAAGLAKIAHSWATGQTDRGAAAAEARTRAGAALLQHVSAVAASC